MTPHFHQAKMMGVTDLAEEILQNISLYEENDKGKNYLLASINELRKCLKTDLTSALLFSDIKEYYEDRVKTLNPEKPQKSSIAQIGTLCKRITDNKINYFTTLKEILLDSLFTEKDITKKHTIAIEIHALTNSYVTFLLNAGYSPKYLYNKSELLTRKSNYNTRTFKDQVIFLFTTLDCKKREFTTFFALKTNKLSTVHNLATSKNVKVITQIPEKHFTISNDTFSKFEPDFYLKITYEALDYVGAALTASSLLEAEIDFLKTLSSSIKILCHTDCYVDYRSKGHTFQRKLRLNTLNKLLTYDQRSQLLSGFLEFDFRAKLDTSSVRKIEGILQNLRQVKDSVRLEQKLLNLWISLESLSFTREERSIISSVTTLLPKVYAIKSLEQRITYTLSLLEKLNIAIPDSVSARHNLNAYNFNKKISIDQFYDLITNTDSARAICKSFNGEDLAYFRFYELYLLLEKKEHIKARVKQTKETIENQLYRIYKKRNQIVHIGHSENLNQNLINYLSEYVNSMILEVLGAARDSRHINNISLDDILLSLQMVVDAKFKAIETDAIISTQSLQFDVII
jgi:hypothetical protein